MWLAFATLVLTVGSVSGLTRRCQDKNIVDESTENMCTGITFGCTYKVSYINLWVDTALFCGGADLTVRFNGQSKSRSNDDESWQGLTWDTIMPAGREWVVAVTNRNTVCNCEPVRLEFTYSEITVDECTYNDAWCTSCATARTSCANTNPVQQCYDPDHGSCSLNDWQCRCPAPYTGQANQAAATCAINECESTSAQCATCEFDVCSQATPSQLCFDPDTEVASDWVCMCPAPSTGSAIAAQAACQIDECTVTCPTCEKDACDAAGQDCSDPNKAFASTRDWTCSCRMPLSGQATAQTAVCTLDECLVPSCASCAGTTCSAENQDCVEPNPSSTSLRDWRCKCRAPALGSADTAAASCQIDECVETSAACTTCDHGTCDGAGQTCVDLDIDAKSLSDWQCFCKSPATGSAVAMVSTCEIDECLYTCPTCGTCPAEQTCDDPNKDAASLSDWTCTCDAPTTGNAVAQAAVCVLNECTAMCPTCAGTTCDDMGQPCVDNDPSPQSKGNWACTCPDPYKTVPGTGMGGVAHCEINECEEMTCASCAKTTCTDAGQVCNDPNLDSKALDDWTCTCAPPLQGVATAGAAICRINECVDMTCMTCAKTTCTDAGQNCNDPDDLATSLNDWECVCKQPATGTAMGMPATCTINECTVTSALCTTCAQGTCQAEDQDCSDSNTDAGSLSDWTCTCKAPKEGTETAKAAACTLNECTATCPSCAGTKCTDAGQTCDDPNKADDSLDDWTCNCSPPTVGSATAQSASCTINECEEMTCMTCAKTTCTDAGQTCDDPDNSAASLMDWTCTCAAPATGRATFMVATCTINECDVSDPACVTCEHGKCTDNGQTCTDPDEDSTVLSDWVCACVAPATGMETAATADCEIDECTYMCSSCAGMTCPVGQTCEDPNKSATSLSDWECVCDAPSVGRAKERPADCVLDECEATCPTCEMDVCTAAQQTCNDASQLPGDTGDWVCECAAPSSDTNVAGPVAGCTMDECVVTDPACTTCAGTTCTDSDQDCTDVDTAVASTGDWECRCKAPSTGVGQAAVAMCILNECTATCMTCAGTTCTDAGQMCVDPNEAATSLSDWECQCPAPSQGTAVTATATCTINECEEMDAACMTCARDTCTAAKQLCDDPNFDAAVLGDWTCSCADPFTGTVMAAVATCTVDECRVQSPACTTCARTTCTAVGQTCLDPDTSDVSLSDWVCSCPAPATGSAVAMVSTCEIDECLYTCPTCGTCPAEQTCDDPNKDAASLSDWTCTCDAPTTGNAVAQAAVCVLNECTAMCPTCAGTTCDDMGQPCVDNDPSPQSKGNWACTCPDPYKKVPGTGMGGVAHCEINECEEMTCASCAKTTCTDAGQVCNDPNLDSKALKDWTCTCALPAVGVATGQVALCTINECVDMTCMTCAKTTCTDAGQTCEDPDKDANVVGDWVCKCGLPSRGSAMAAAATCTLDECEEVCTTCEQDTCSTAGQICDDPNTSPSTTSDWTCACEAPLNGSAVAVAADCTLDECTAACTTCEDGTCDAVPNQTCRDDDTTPKGTGSWVCECTAPYTGTFTAEAKECGLDECMATCASCANGACTGVMPMQECNDPVKTATATGDWTCTCVAPLVGDAVTAAADCALDECEAMCPTCEMGACPGPEQACNDPMQTPTSTRDWTCTCSMPFVGEATAMTATCTLNECVATCPTCAMGACGTQTCEDPKQETWSTSDWTCSCVAPEVGQATAKAAACELNECKAMCPTCVGATCSDAGQECEDPVKTPASTGDWMCLCVAPEDGARVGKAAVCTIDECRATCSSCAGAACTREGQECEDKDMRADSRGDWECVCPPPSSGRGVRMAASCTLDECEEDCLTCEKGACRDVGQTCKDDIITADKSGHGLRDWVCRCEAPFVGEAWGAPAVCTLDECKATCATCENNDCGAKGQTCNDPDTSSGSVRDWTCSCPTPATGAAVGRAATCALDECVVACATCANNLCATAGQTCSDPAPYADRKGDWLCACPAPDTGVTAVAAVVAACPTPAPPTPAPPGPTGTPETFAPLSMAPGGTSAETFAPQGLVSVVSFEKVGIGGQAVAVGGAPSAALRMVVAGGSCGEDPTLKTYSWALHPTQWTLYGDMEAGMVVGNFAICMGFWAVCYIVLMLITCCGKTVAPLVFAEMDAQGLMRFPSAPLFVFQFLYTGTVLGSMTLIEKQPTDWGFAIGIGGMLTCCAVPFLIWKSVTQDVPRLAVYVRDPDEKGKYTLVRFLCGPGEWVNRSKRTNWMARWSVAVRAYKQPLAWWMFFDFAVSFAIAAVHATPIERGSFLQCGHQKTTAAVVFMFVILLESVYQPQCRFRDIGASLMANALQCTAMGFMAAGYYKEDLLYVGFDIAGALMTVALVIMMLKTILDVLMLAYVLIGGRRRRIQAAMDARFPEGKEWDTSGLDGGGDTGMDMELRHDETLLEEYADYSGADHGSQSLRSLSASMPVVPGAGGYSKGSPSPAEFGVTRGRPYPPTSPSAFARNSPNPPHAGSWRQPQVSGHASSMIVADADAPPKRKPSFGQLSITDTTSGLVELVPDDSASMSGSFMSASASALPRRKVPRSPRAEHRRPSGRGFASTSPQARSSGMGLHLYADPHFLPGSPNQTQQQGAVHYA